MTLQHWSNKNLIALGREFKGIKVNPSDKKYFGDYQYKLTLKGNHICYDIQMYKDLHQALNSAGWWYRIQATSKNINVYVNDTSYLDNVIDTFKDTNFITGLYGPINEAHIESLQDRNTEYVYRNKYWYNKYNIKISFRRIHSGSYEDKVQQGKEFRDFIKGSFDNFRLFDDYTDSWYQNYLWLTQEEYNQGYPFLKLSYGNLIDKIQTIKLTEI